MLFILFSRLTPLQRRQLEGCLCRVPVSFYHNVWDVVTRTPEGLKVMGNVISQQPTISNMTRSEISFALLVEQVRIYSTSKSNVLAEFTFRCYTPYNNQNIVN